MIKDTRIKVDIPNDVKNSLDKLSVKTGNSKAALIRQAVIELIQHYKDKGLIE
ncbi:CopG family transcriptional regulator [Nostoc sp. FACHB-133]|uniref:ribbon-helix-helix domain-containing protein n=1 Tax=Nostoc sp. FACHB-133 TaxID=2692835 RepID=UPI0016899C1F|nr:CopG family transcriptional regulator [Nostoc sp. FACHB-133]MBD2522121.1 ribbon-helix-helix domain-containing protein [Nostoc sp. FACHB-133]